MNIKIALKGPEQNGRVDPAAREALLASMTDDVAALVLSNNARQALALSLATRAAKRETSFARRTMAALEAKGRLDRAVEFLPDDGAIVERLRQGNGLTRPEFAVIMAYAKLDLHDELLGGSVVDDPFFLDDLLRYFPRALRDRFPQEMEGHRLRRELTATALSNAVVNDGGPSVAVRMAEETGRSAGEVAKAYAIARAAFDLPDLIRALDGLAGRAPGQAQLELYAAVQDFLVGRIEWLLRSVDLTGPVAPLARRYREGAGALLDAAPDLLGAPTLASLRAREADLVAPGMPAPAARLLAAFDLLASGFDAVDISRRVGCSVTDAASAKFGVDQALGRSNLELRIAAVQASDAFDRIALGRTNWSINAACSALAAEALRHRGPEGVRQWLDFRVRDFDAARRTISSLASSDMTVAKAFIAADLMNDLAAGPDRVAGQRS